MSTGKRHPVQGKRIIDIVLAYRLDKCHGNEES